MQTVFVRKMKRPVGSGLWRAYVLGEDRFGLWLHTPQGSLYRGEDGDTVGHCEVAQGSRNEGTAIVQLIQTRRCWIATWMGHQHDPSITVDICTPPALVGAEWRFADLELDPFLARDGDVGTDDWDEFAVSADSGLISSGEQREARAAVAAVESQLGARREPFGHVGHERLREALDVALTPLTDLTGAELHVAASRPWSNDG